MADVGQFPDLIPAPALIGVDARRTTPRMARQALVYEVTQTEIFC
jgi:hypothetical protein